MFKEEKVSAKKDYVTGIIPYSWTSEYNWVLESDKSKRLTGRYTWREAKAVLDNLARGTKYIAPCGCSAWVLLETGDMDTLSFAIVNDPNYDIREFKIASYKDFKGNIGHRAFLTNEIVQVNANRLRKIAGEAFFEELMDIGVAVVFPSSAVKDSDDEKILTKEDHNINEDGIPDNMAILSKDVIAEIFDGNLPFTGFEDYDHTFRYVGSDRFAIAQNFFRRATKCDKNDMWKMSAYIDFDSDRNNPHSRYVRFESFSGKDVNKEVLTGFPHLIDSLASHVMERYDLNDEDFYVSCSFKEGVLSVQLIMLGLGKIWSKEAGLFKGGNGLVYVPAIEYEYSDHKKKADGKIKKIDSDSICYFESKKLFYGINKTRKDNSFRICSFFSDPLLKRRLGQMSVKSDRNIEAMLSSFTTDYADIIVEEEMKALEGAKGSDYENGLRNLFHTIVKADKEINQESAKILSAISNPDVDFSDEDIEAAENANEKLFMETVSRCIMKELGCKTVLKNIEESKLPEIVKGVTRLSHFNKGAVFTKKHVLNAVGCLVVQIKGIKSVTNAEEYDVESKGVGLYVTTNGEKKTVTKTRTWDFKDITPEM